MSLNPGTYLIINYRHRNLASVPDSNDGSPVRAQDQRNVNGEQWIVEKLGNGMYTFQNAYHKTYAYIDDRTINASRAYHLRQQFAVQDVPSNQGLCYAIKTTDGQFWQLGHVEYGTPITLSNGPTTDASNLWLFTEPKSVSTGIYFITNVRHKNIAVSSQENNSVTASFRKNVDAEKWEVVKGSDGLCSVRNIGKSLFVTTSQPVKGAAVEMADGEHALEIQETAIEGQYTIATGDSQLFWGLSDKARGSKITYYDVPLDSCNWWIFTSCETPEPSSSPTHNIPPRAMTGPIFSPSYPLAESTKLLQVKKIQFSEPLYNNKGPLLAGTLFTYEPPVEDLKGWYHLGPAAASRSGVRRYGIVVKELEEGVLADIKDWEPVWNNANTTDLRNYSLWRGIPPSTDYVVVGSFYVNGWEKPKARDFKGMKAVRKDVLVQVNADREIWHNKNYRFGGPAAMWDIDERGDACDDSAINTGAFLAVTHYQSSPVIYAINASRVELVV